ncbi:MAG TPA: DUF4159 domain-containing protein [Gemmatimonadales bacterium]
MILLFLLGAGSVLAQRRRNSDALPNAAYDGKFTFLRIRYDPGSGGFGDGTFGGRDPKWNHDYPRAELHFSKILKELSLVQAYLGGGNVLMADDPELFKYPIAYISEPGFWTVNEKEAEALRNYLLKGGFLIFDDFEGNHWYNFERQMRLVLPNARLVRLDASHPIFDSFFRIESLEFVSYRGVSEFWGIFEDNDPAKRLLAMVNYNSDIAEYWEWSDTDFAPIELTNEAYKLGVNYVIYAMTH